jgi:hypothetical protein
MSTRKNAVTFVIWRLVANTWMRAGTASTEAAARAKLAALDLPPGATALVLPGGAVPWSRSNKRRNRQPEAQS